MRNKSLQIPSIRHETAVSDLIFLVAIILMGASLRFFRLDYQSMWFDEAARLLIARADIRTIIATTGGDTMPPLFHLMMHGWQRLGLQDFWTRLPSAFAGILLIAVMFQLGKTLFDNKTGLVAGTAVAILPYLIFHAQQANLYSIFVLFAALIMLIFWRAIQKPQQKNRWAAYGVMMVLAFYLHYFIVFVSLVQNLLVFWRYRRKEVLQPLLVTDVVIFIICLPYIAIFLNKVNEVSAGFWLESPSVLQPLLTYSRFISGYALPGATFAIALGLVLAILAVVLLEIRHHWRTQLIYRQSILYCLLLAFVPTFLIWLISQRLPIYLDRTLLFVLPAYVLLLAFTLAHTRRQSPLLYLSGLMILLLAFSLYNYYAVPDFQKEDYRGAATAVAAYQAPGDVIVHTGNGSYIPFLIYLPPTDHFLLAGDPAPHHPSNVHENGGGNTITQAELKQYDRIILVVALDHSIEFQQQAVDQFETMYDRIDDLSFNNIVIRVYELSPR